MGAPVARRISFLVLAGFLVGLVVLGLGGRILMRVLAFTTPESPRFTFSGTAQIIGAGAVWGAVTAPLLLALAKWQRRFGNAFGSLFGLVVMMPALALFLLFSGFDGDLVAPPFFVVGTVLFFPLLFTVHGHILVATAGRRISLRNGQARREEPFTHADQRLHTETRTFR